MPGRLQSTCTEVDEQVVGAGVLERLHSLPRGWRRGIYVQLHHGEIAAETLSDLGSDAELVRLVKRHHCEPGDERERRLRDIDDSL